MPLYQVGKCSFSFGECILSPGSEKPTLTNSDAQQALELPHYRHAATLR